MNLKINIKLDHSDCHFGYKVLLEIFYVIFLYSLQTKYAKELDQWLRKMKCSGSAGMRLENFRDIKVGINPDPVTFRSPSLEPYPNIKDEEFTFKGGKDDKGRFKGKGVIEFENGDIITAFFVEGRREGECRVETFRNKLRLIIGNYQKKN